MALFYEQNQTAHYGFLSRASADLSALLLRKPPGLCCAPEECNQWNKARLWPRARSSFQMLFEVATPRLQWHVSSSLCIYPPTYTVQPQCWNIFESCYSHRCYFDTSWQNNPIPDGIVLYHHKESSRRWPSFLCSTSALARYKLDLWNHTAGKMSC